MLSPRFTSRPEWPYVAPMAAFVVLTALEAWLPRSSAGPDSFWYPWAYTAKIAIVSAVAWICRTTWRDLGPRPTTPALGLAVGLGLLVTALWVGLDGHYPSLPGMGTRQGFEPTVLSRPAQVAFLAVRFFGLVVLVPLIEELFWRSFLWRWVIDQDFTKVPIGLPTPAAVVVTSGLFALAHPEWLPALLTGLLWAGLLAHTSNLGACLVSHATANLILGIYVIITQNWKFL